METIKFTPKRTPGVFKTSKKKLHDRLALEGFDVTAEGTNERGFTVWGYKPTQELRDSVELFRMDNPIRIPTTKSQEENTHDSI